MGSSTWKVLEAKMAEIGGLGSWPKGPAYTAVSDDVNDLSKEQKNMNAVYIYDYLTQEGWSQNAIIGLLANIQRESGLNPGIWQDFNNTGLGYGLIQWSKFEDNNNIFLDWAGFYEYNEDGSINTNSTVQKINFWAEIGPKRMMDIQLEFIMASMWSPSEQYRQWLPDIADYTNHPLDYGTPAKMTWQEFLTSDHDPRDLALVFHASYEKSGDDTSNTGRENSERRRMVYVFHWKSITMRFNLLVICYGE